MPEAIVKEKPEKENKTKQMGPDVHLGDLIIILPWSSFIISSCYPPLDQLQLTVSLCIWKTLRRQAE